MKFLTEANKSKYINTYSTKPHCYNVASLTLSELAPMALLFKISHATARLYTGATEP